MSKARILADTIADGAELADGAIAVAEVTGAAPLASPDFTGTLSLAGVDLTPTFTQLNHVAGVSSAIQTQINTKSPIAGPTFTGTATADILNVDEASFLAIAKDISDTAVDVFVYDTSKDSDGGAWRKRTQHTSWYSEAASSTRGSRKEFPAVAVIVGEANEVTIYDGDDPDMPMWMVLTVGNGTWLKHSGSGGLKALAALNGMLVTGGDIRGAIVNFIADNGDTFEAGHNYQHSGVITRNSAAGPSTGSISIVNNTVNDVAMTVLPNAPIDYATGLPVPTIAMATNGGTSIIRDDGTVDNHADSKSNTAIEILGTNYAILRNATGVPLEISPLNDAGAVIMNYRDDGGSLGSYYPQLMVGFDPTSTVKSSYGAGKGLNILDDDILSTSTTAQPLGKVAYITSDYNTGWMNGAIKLATLSDTDTTNVVGSNLISNGTFSNTTGWTALNSTISIDSNRLKVADNGGYTKAYASFATVVGKTYTVSVDVAAISGQSAVLAIGHATPSGSAWNSQTASSSVVTTLSITRTATQTTTYVELGSEGTNFAIFDNVEARIAEEDRSVNGKGVQVYGTVTKTVVATGADLVAYSGFSSSNFLQQPYNAGLDFGTGNFNVTLWLKSSTDGVGCAFHRGSGSSGTWGAGIIQIEKNTSNFSLNVSANGFSAVSTLAVDETLVRNGNWNCVNAGRLNGKLFIYINGLRVGSLTTSSTENLTNTAAKLWIGERPNASRPWDGDIALVRVSATVPSPEQITKIFNDEKHLFQAGAKATLHGTSDSVTALAYDDTTDLLHVGTSAGRSVFQGLRRVENTTNAVGAAISASNGLVAED